MTAVLSVLVLVSSALVAYNLYTKVDAAVQSSTADGSVADFLTPEALEGEATGAVNILIAGNSVDDTGHTGATLTDSIMVAQIDLTTKKLSLVSIPRDLWVTVNGESMKLNAVYTVGGMSLLQSTVEEITGLTINHQALINYAAFKNMIDAVGGIDVTIDSDDPRGIYDPMIGFRIASGEQHLDGTQALLLARSRNDPTYDGRIAYGLPNGDFDRATYQRKIAEALLTKVANTSTLTNTSKLSSLFASLSGNVDSNFTVSQLRRLYDLSKEMTATQSISIRGSEKELLLANYTSYDGQSALIPAIGVGDYAQIHEYIFPMIHHAAT